MVDLVKYNNLFIHRADVFAVQHDNGAYTPVEQPLDVFDIEAHLAGDYSIGTYVIRPEDNTVKYVVFDLDTNDEGDLELLKLGVNSLLETVYPSGGYDPDFRKCLLLETSGRKGWHVWLFLSEPLPARQVRAWLGNFGAVYPGPTLEIFPKQDVVDEGGYGNLVKLPLGVHAVSKKRSEFVPCEGWASGVEGVVPLPSALVPEVKPPDGSSTSWTRSALGSEEGSGVPRVAMSGPASPFPCIDRIQNEGVPSGYRDNAMFHLALYCYGHGVPEDLAEEMCERANEQFDPPLNDQEVRGKVRSAYRGRYASARCGADWLKDICPGPCREGWSVRQASAGYLKTSTPGDVVEVEVLRTLRDGDRVRVTVTHPDAENEPTLVCRR